MRYAKAWRTAALVLAVLFLLGLVLPHDHEAAEEEDGHKDCIACELQHAVGTCWFPSPGSMTLTLEAEPFVPASAHRVAVPAQFSPHGPRAPPAV